eukprot:jgi/Ulvmu1/1446/UM011_0176.1
MRCFEPPARRHCMQPRQRQKRRAAETELMMLVAAAPAERPWQRGVGWSERRRCAWNCCAGADVKLMYRDGCSRGDDGGLPLCCSSSNCHTDVRLAAPALPPVLALHRVSSCLDGPADCSHIYSLIGTREFRVQWSDSHDMPHS